MNNKGCGPDIIKHFIVEPASTISGSTGDFYVCNGTIFLNMISGCTDNININNTTFYNNGDVNLYNLSATTLNITTTPQSDTNNVLNLLTRDNGVVKTKTIPNTINYGVFAQTGDSVMVSGTTVETTLINGGVGSLSVLANGFSIGDTFRGSFSGNINCSNNEKIRIRIKTGSIVLGDSGIQTLPAISNTIWRLDMDFTIRNVGVSGVASIVSTGIFNYTKSSNSSQEGFAFNTINNTTFDTTIPNTLNVTVEWGSNNSNNFIHSHSFSLNKIF